MLRKTVERYKEFENLIEKLIMLYEKSQRDKLTEKEKSRMKSLIDKLQKFSPLQFELLVNIRAIKKYISEQYWWDSMNSLRANRVRYKFFEQLSQKYKLLSKLKIDDSNFDKNKVKMILIDFINSLIISQSHKLQLLEETTEILNTLMKLMELGEISIPKSLSNKKISAVILYTAVISSNRFKSFFISDKIYEMIGGYWNLSAPYNRYFATYYPRVREFPIRKSKLSILEKVKFKIIATFLENLLNSLEIAVSEYVRLLKIKILNDKLPKNFTSEDRTNLMRYLSK